MSLKGFRQRMTIDYPYHITSLLPRQTWERYEQNRNDETTVVVDVAASRADVTVEIGVDRPVRPVCARLSGPWLLGSRDSTIANILAVATDAITEGKTKSASEIIAEAIEKGGRGNMLQFRPVVVPVRMRMLVRISLNDGAPAGPCDVWVRTLSTRDVA